MKSLTVQIPKPCHERWADMLPNGQGRFCASCQKTVVDYTALSDHELILLLNKTTGTACGRFRNDQLNRPVFISNKDKTPVWRHWLGMLTMGLLSWQTTQAQVNQPIIPAQRVTVLPEHRPSDQSVRDTSSQDTAPRITGTVLDIDSAGRQMVLPGANVVIKNANRGVTADSNGMFQLKIPADLLNTPITLVVCSVGLITQEINIIAEPQHLSIALKEDEEAMNQVIRVGGYHVSRWQKIKHKLFHPGR